MVGVATRLLELVPGHRTAARIRPAGAGPGPGCPARRRAGVRRGPRVRELGRARRLPRWPRWRPRRRGVRFGRVGSWGIRATPTAQRLIADAAFHQGGRDVGEVYAYRDSPMWLKMTVHGVKGRPKVTCELVGTDGSRTRLGSFDLVGRQRLLGCARPWGLAGDHRGAAGRQQRPGSSPPPPSRLVGRHPRPEEGIEGRADGGFGGLLGRPVAGGPGVAAGELSRVTDTRSRSTAPPSVPSGSDTASPHFIATRKLPGMADLRLEPGLGDHPGRDPPDGGVPPAGHLGRRADSGR